MDPSGSAPVHNLSEHIFETMLKQIQFCTLVAVFLERAAWSAVSDAEFNGSDLKSAHLWSLLARAAPGQPDETHRPPTGVLFWFLNIVAHIV